MKNVLEPYGKQSVFTENLLQGARKAVRKELYGTDDDNVQYTMALKLMLENNGHKVMVDTTSRKAVLQSMYDVVWAEEKARRKVTKVGQCGKEDMRAYCTQWCDDNSTQLYLDLGDPADDLKFLHGIYLAPSSSVNMVPRLQNVFQADAAHINWGKYTLFSLYGTTANGKMAPVTLAIVFGNENNAGWAKFFRFAVQVHPHLNKAEVTIITDQCKGSTAAIRDILPNAYHFYCSYHRLQNIALKCRGGRGRMSPHGVFRQMLACNNVWDLENIRERTAAGLGEKVTEYFYKINDAAQFPSARCNMDPSIYLYDHEASSGVESMNNANKAVRNHSAVDPVNSIILLLNLEAKRYAKEHKAAWAWETSLTPKGEEICHKAFEEIVCNNYTLALAENEEHHVTTVTRREGGQYFIVNTLKEACDGSMFGSCTCGVTQTKTIPCVHMVAIVQSGQIPSLTQLTVMPTWCMTATWRKQYPANTSMEVVMDINHLKASMEPSLAIRCCPKIATPRKPGGAPAEKRGAKAKGKRKKGPLEKPKRQKKRVGVPMEDLLQPAGPSEDGDTGLV